MSTAESSKKPLAPIWVGLAIWLFFPLGLYLLWRHPTLGKNGKWWAAGITWACLLMFMGSRAENEDVSSPDKPEKTLAEASPDTPKPKKKSNRKLPQIKMKLDDKTPEVQQAYRDGFEAGITLANDLLDDIEAKAGRMDVKKFINANPIVSADLEKLQVSMVRQSGEAAGRVGQTLADLAAQGIFRNLQQHPAVLEATEAQYFTLGKSHAYNDIIKPLLDGK